MNGWQPTMTVRTALLQGQKLLVGANIGEPRLTAEVLLMRATGHDRAWLYAHGHDELIEVWWIHYGPTCIADQGEPRSTSPDARSLRPGVSGDAGRTDPRPETEHH